MIFGFVGKLLINILKYCLYIYVVNFFNCNKKIKKILYIIFLGCESNDKDCN